MAYVLETAMKSTRVGTYYASIPPMIVSKFTNPSPPPMINIQICYWYVSALARLKVLARVALRGVRHDKLTCITHS